MTYPSQRNKLRFNFWCHIQCLISQAFTLKGIGWWPLTEYILNLWGEPLQCSIKILLQTSVSDSPDSTMTPSVNVNMWWWNYPGRFYFPGPLDAGRALTELLQSSHFLDEGKEIQWGWAACPRSSRHRVTVWFTVRSGAFLREKEVLFQWHQDRLASV